MAASIKVFIYLQFLYIFITPSYPVSLPLVINTWGFTNATQKAWSIINNGGKTAMDALVAGCTECEILQCDTTVGYGGSPDEIGETTLDAMVMDGKTQDVGSVGDLRGIKNAIGVARAVMEYTEHTLIVGESASKFAVEMGFTNESLTTNTSIEMTKNWKKNNCQPNFRQNVTPDPKKSCGPYKPIQNLYNTYSSSRIDKNIGKTNHDTIGMLIIDNNNNIVAGTSTNGANHKIPGRVGDSPIAGAGAYARNKVGGAAATGDGDIMMRFLPSFNAVMLLELGYSPEQAALKALNPIIQFYPSFVGALIVTNTNGSFAAACHGLPNGFPYSVRNTDMKDVKIITVPCV
ncbi:hypothetical protein SNE40_016691 [Patella caerulea]|uniref:N(4)-(beta-N-acetylglucosaminyl)-L-asparaginase n=1 Tax=Patella caerulea TaxID=87958 RepID=A0AAN8J910_PATCE